MNYANASLATYRRQQGLALIMAVLIAALATTAIAFAAWRQQVRLREAEIQNDSAQAQLLLRASITIARTSLIDDARADTRNGGGEVDAPSEMLFTHVEDTDVEQGHARGRVEDASGRFDLNSLINRQGGTIDPLRMSVYAELLRQLRLPAALAPALGDWLDGDDETLPDGAEDMHYLGQNPPYRPANGPLGDLNELVRIKGYTPAVIAALRPHVEVFPPINDPSAGGWNSRVNINFCSPELLIALFRGLDPSDAKAMVAAVKDKPYSSFADFNQRMPQGAQNRLRDDSALAPTLDQLLSYNSRHVYALVQIDYGTVHWSEKVLLRRLSRDRTEVLRRQRLPE